MPKLYFIPTSRDDDVLPPVRLLRASTAEPTHEEIMKELVPVSGIWEHISVLADGRRLHLFGDDNARAFNLPVNLRASVLYANASLDNRGGQPYGLAHILESTEASDRFLRYQDYRKMRQFQLFVFGDALLWTGEMS